MSCSSPNLPISVCRMLPVAIAAALLPTAICGAGTFVLDYDITGTSVPLGSAGGGQTFTPEDAPGAESLASLELVEFSLFRGNGGTGSSQCSPTTYLVIYDGNPDTATQIGASANFVATAINDATGTKYTWMFDNLTLDATKEYWAVLSNNRIDNNVLQSATGTGTWLQMSFQTTNNACAAGTDASLRSPVIDLTDVTAASLTFAQAMDTAPTHAAVVNIIEESTGTVIAAAIHTSTPDLQTTDSAWRMAAPITIPAAALGRRVRIEWRFTGDGDNTYMGWYIDDVVLTRS